MAVLTQKMRNELLRHARNEVRGFAKSRRNPLLALAQARAHGIAHDALKEKVAARMLEGIKSASQKYGVDMGKLVTGALAGRAYEGELLKALRKNACNKIALAGLGIADAKAAIAESRERLALAKKAEGLSARCAELSERVFRENDPDAAKEFIARMEELMAGFNAYYASLARFHKRAEDARKRGVHEFPRMVLPGGFGG